ncbi:MAG: ADP-dependent NAD(P)H-hydrate dehydratase [Clostridiales bacterium]|jgi:NAD(P)H-hydrate epimerase|nr:ADP-dependent NAD(P)H-hydrate dehydratase [Clostridiales bacterium]
MTTITQELIVPLLRPRPLQAHKGMYGRLLLVAGCRMYRGAAQLAVLGALRIGTGIVTLASIEPVLAATVSALPECTLLPLSEGMDGLAKPENAALLADAAADCSAVVLGCGLGQGPGPTTILERLTTAARVPLLLDADGLNLLARAPQLLHRRAGPTILTPHPGEMARLCGKTAAEVQHAREATATRFAAEFQCIVVLKGHDTLVALPSGQCFFNKTGGPGLAKAGSGDLLTGLIGGLMAQGLAPADAAICGVYLHGAAADLCSARKSSTGMLPHELAEDLCSLLLSYEL